jgi:YD repeat-containing protein
VVTRERSLATTKWVGSTRNGNATRQNCGLWSFYLSFGYDGIGDLTSEDNGVGTSFAYTFNGAGRLISAGSNLVDTNHPATLFSAIHYYATGMEHYKGEFLLGNRQYCYPLTVTDHAWGSASNGSSRAIPSKMADMNASI